MRKLHEIMSHVASTAEVTESVDQVRERMRLLRVHQLVVMEGAAVVGVVARGDLPHGHVASRKDPVPLRARTKPVIVAPASTTLAAAEERLGAGADGVVVTLDGSVVGYVTAAALRDALDADGPRPRDGRTSASAAKLSSP